MALGLGVGLGVPGVSLTSSYSQDTHTYIGPLVIGRKSYQWHILSLPLIYLSYDHRLAPRNNYVPCYSNNKATVLGCYFRTKIVTSYLQAAC